VCCGRLPRLAQAQALLTGRAQVYAMASAGGYLAAEPAAALVDGWATAKAVDDAARVVESVQRLQVAEAVGVVERAVESVQHLQVAEAVGVDVPVAA
jgi:hypothetical protein